MNWDMSTLNITSVSGIVLTTLFLVEILKRALQHAAWFKCVPVFVYSMIIAGGMAFLANRVIKTNDGSPILQGELWKVIWASIVGAAASSGFYTWLKPENVEQAMKNGSNIGPSTKSHKLLFLLLIPMFAIGCTSCPEKSLLRESLARTASTTNQLTRDWANKLTIDPATGKNQADQITPLTPAQRDNVLKNIDEFDATIVEDRQTESERGFFGVK